MTPSPTPLPTFFGLDDVAWVAVGAIAMLIAAAATVGLGAATYWLARTTRAQLQQIRREITATERQADASTKMIAEVQMDRDLNWRPYVRIVKAGWGGDQPQGRDVVTIQNIGRGPAFNCLCLRLLYMTVERGGVKDQVPLWRLSLEPEIMEAGGVNEVDLLDPQRPVPMMLFEPNPPPQPTLSLFYQDILGERAYRIAIPRSAPDVWSPGQKVEPWVSWYFGQLNLPVPTPKTTQ